MTKFLMILMVPILALGFGCGKQRSSGTQSDNINVEKGLRRTIPVLDRTIALQQLTAIGMAFRLMAGEGRAPSKIEDLEPYYENRKITQAVKDGSIVVILGTNPEKQPAEAILAFTAEPDAQNEHVVLLCNLAVQVMGKPKFDAAPKAKGN